MEELTVKRTKEFANDDPIICNCFAVKASTIKMAIESGDATSIEEVSELTFAGTGCRSC